MVTQLLNSLLDPIPPLTPSLAVPAVLFVALIGVGLFLSFTFRPIHGLQEKLRGYWSNLVWSAGTLGLIVLAFRYLGTPWLGSNLVLGLIIVVSALWALLIYRWQRTGYRDELELLERRQIHAKYLP